MRLGGEGPSGNFEDRTGSSGGMGFGGGGGGNLLGCLLPMVMSRFGIVGVLILLLGYCALTQLGGGGSIIPGGTTTSAPSGGASKLDPNMRDFLTRTLGSTEETWGEIFQKNGQSYTPTRMVAYTRGTQTECGFGQAAMGPFYCPNDRSIYIDPTFFNELTSRFGAAGDAAMAYVIAHEVGHHLQALEGTLDRAQSAQARANKADGNAIQVGVELQADCYAGIWMARARDAQGPIVEPGDAQEALTAAEAIGDDTLQRKTQGSVVPESFTHGTSAQRMAALQRGIQTGDPAQCNFAR